MPNYDYTCSSCLNEWTENVMIAQRNRVKCSCGEKATLQIRAPGVSAFKPMWFRDIDVKPMFISSKRELKDECDKRGLIATRLT